jgi:preprotein translocase subunit YajC
MLNQAFLALIQATDTAAPSSGTAPAGGAATPAAAPPGWMQFIPFLAIGGIMYFLLIGPERKARKKREELLSKLEKGDKVVTSSGLHGVIKELNETTVTLQVDDGVRLKFSRSAVADVVKDSDAKPAETKSAK